MLQNISVFTFDVTSAYTHAWEDELVFLEPPRQEIKQHGDCVWRSIREIHGRRKGARSWQEHFDDSILRSEEARQRGLTVDSHPMCPTLYCVREADGLIELQVDDGHGCGKDTIVAELLACLSEKVDMKYVQGIWSGNLAYLKGACSTKWSASQDVSNFSSKLPSHVSQRNLPKQSRFSNCVRRNPLFSEHIHSILIASAEYSICTQVFSRGEWLMLL